MHTLVLERRTAGHRNDVERERTLTDSGDDFFFREAVGIFEIFLHEAFVLLCSEFDHLAAPFLAFCEHVSGDILNVVFCAHRLIVPKDSLHLDEVNDAFELFFCTDRYGNDTRSCAEHILHLAHNFEEVGTGAVHLVHVADTGYVVFVSLTPNRFTLRLYAAHCAVGGNSAVEHAERTFYLSGEVHVSRSVNKVELILIAVPSPIGGSGGRSNGDTALLFLRHPVHGCAAVVHFTDFVRLTRVEKDTLRRGGLTGVDVRHNTDVTGQV